MAYTDTEVLEKLVAEIGRNVYMDIAKWHLYLSDANLAWAIAERVYPILTEGNLEESKVVEILEDIPVMLGENKRQIPLIDLIPSRCQVDLMDLLERHQGEIAAVA